MKKMFLSSCLLSSCIAFASTPQDDTDKPAKPVSPKASTSIAISATLKAQTKAESEASVEKTTKAEKVEVSTSSTDKVNLQDLLKYIRFVDGDEDNIFYPLSWHTPPGYKSYIAPDDNQAKYFKRAK